MKGKVPRCVPRKFPLVWHGHHALVVKMAPPGVPSVFTFRRRRRESGIALKPLLHDIMIKLFTPKHSGERLTPNRTKFLTQTRGRERGVEFVRFMRTLCKRIIEVRERAEGFLALRDSLQP